MPPLSESEFVTLASAALDRLESDIETAADAADADIEINRTGNVMELEFEDGSKIIVNSQAPMQELWVAARAGGFHFRRDGERWVDTRSGGELYQALSQYLSQQAGTTITLR
ncbi:iron donor protein CyaY [Cupriavidus respiraculi]|uniref:Iron-sulfur cluster assembly protein CyaY n=1 Tax=Cupriavidus respiraculi TaxID=195930 RepID=A0ABN7ZEI5_9BURK|nr:iron donor protein CyaY [Cupriavidus respiraculi]CAG9182741.1 Iron-sulfur cluster assembly protein CyaY [Cupriavidus respiraculi]